MTDTSLPCQIRRVLFLAQGDAERVTGSPRRAIISVTSPGRAPARLQDGWGATLRLQFDDVDPVTFPGQNRELVPMSVADAHAISVLLSTLPNSTRSLIVHCRAGISRSAGIAKAIAEVLGLRFHKDYICQNRHVYALMMAVLTPRAHHRRNCSRGGNSFVEISPRCFTLVP